MKYIQFKKKNKTIQENVTIWINIKELKRVLTKIQEYVIFKLKIGGEKNA